MPPDLGKAPLGQVACRLALPVRALPRHLADFGRAVPLPHLGEQPAALDTGKLPVVAGENHLRAGRPRLRQQFAGDARVQHRRLVHH